MADPGDMEPGGLDPIGIDPANIDPEASAEPSAPTAIQGAVVSPVKKQAVVDPLEPRPE